MRGARATTPDLFDSAADAGGPAVAPWLEALGPGALVWRGGAAAEAAALLAEVQTLVAQAPFRRLVTPGGFRMSVAMSNCGALGWVSDARGYRYDAVDPDSGRPWPAMPRRFGELAARAAAQAGYPGFAPDACLINRYEPGARLSLHQDRNERDYSAPIVSVSLGLPAVFLFGGGRRSDPTTRVPLVHGDVAVWGGPSRLRYHGVLALKDGEHAATGNCRINLTFRRAG
ncbi:DNA oxidative demethylase AlkB [Methylibium petroleiphilum]|uniref:DNA oxidative demethylase AlkB n=1 Tax=Methylibium petroleiphilum TaxID=105560 RepID=UPI0023532A2B|nr:DNA oxidative demethylase AlkB [Methylibium petroleiphilum]